MGKPRKLAAELVPHKLAAERVSNMLAAERVPHKPADEQNCQLVDRPKSRKAGIVQWSELRTRELRTRGFEFRQEQRANILLQSQLSVLILITPVLLQYHVKYPGYSDKSAGGMLQLNTHAHDVRGFA